jgi:hypothetical protein
VEELAAVVELLGWRGILLPPRRLLGERVAVVTNGGAGGETASFVLGVIAVRAAWTSARRAAGNYAAFCQRVAVVPESALRDRLVPRDAEMRGIGLVVSDARGGLHLVVPPERHVAPPWTPIVDVFRELVRVALEMDARATPVG